MGKADFLLLLAAIGILVGNTSAGSVTKLQPYNAVSTGGISITISGLEFGTTSYTPTIRFDDTSCTTTAWTSDSSVNCLPDYTNWGTGSGLRPYFRGQSTYTSSTDYFTFDAPVVSYALDVANVAQTGETFVTVSGLNFAAIDKTATIRVRAACRTSSWTSATTLQCATREVSTSDNPGGLYGANGVTVTGQVGTMASGLFSYDAPAISNTTPNAPTTGGATITVYGTSFAPVDYTATARLGASGCVSTSWNTNTRMTCLTPAGILIKQSTSLTVSAIVGTRVASLSYDAPAVTYSEPANSPSGGDGAEITIMGLNFGPYDATITAELNNNNGNAAEEICQTTSWTTSTAIVCKPNPAGYQNQREFQVNVASGTTHRGVSPAIFTYDAPVLSFNVQANNPSTGGATVTISGLNFAYVNTTPEAYIGISSCATVSWSSASTVNCQMVPAGAGTNAVSMGRMFNTAGKYYGTLLNAFTFDAPSVSFTHTTADTTTTNGPTSGGMTLSVNGFNFGKYDFTVSAKVGTTACSTVTWKSESSLACLVPTGVGQKLQMSVTVGAVVGTIAVKFTFDSPVLTLANPPNGPPMSGYTITLAGKNLAVSDHSATARIASAMCRSTQWVSETSIVCAAPGGDAGKGAAISVTISAVVGTRTAAFTYDGPVITDKTPVNSPTSGGADITLLGMSFGNSDLTVTAALQEIVCGSVSWYSGTNVVCKAPAGQGPKISTTVTVSAVVGTRLAAFSFDSPVLSAAASENAASTNGGTVTISGLNFGGVSATPTTFLSESACATTSWSSGTTVQCSTPLGQGTQHMLAVVQYSSVGGTALQTFTFDAPAVSFLEVSNFATTGATWTSLSGVNFGASYVTGTVRMGFTPCTTATWSTATMLSCHVRSGFGVAYAGTVSVSATVGTALSAFSYDSPVLERCPDGTCTSGHELNVPTTGGSSVTIMGLNFAKNNLTPSIRIGLSLCASSLWSSATAVKCSTSAGQGSGHHIAVTISAVVGSLALAFSYESPLVSLQTPVNAPTSRAYVTMQGFNFASSAITPTVAISPTLCATSSWNSATTVVCMAPYAAGASRSMIFTLATQVSSMRSVFTYDAPILTQTAVVNAATSAGVSITLLGMNFGWEEYTATATLETAVCGSTSWSSSTSVACQLSATYTTKGGSAISNVVTVTGQLGSAVEAFSYDAPVISAFPPPNGVSTSGWSITIVGVNFGSLAPSPTISLTHDSLGNYDCATTSWSSGTSLLCNPAASAGGPSHNFATTISTVLGTFQEGFTFDAPGFSFATPFNLATTAGAAVVLTGFNFGGIDSTPTATIGKSSCLTVSWSSSTVLSCTGTGGSGTKLLNSAVISTLIGTRAGWFTFDAPAVSAEQAVTQNFAGSGGTVVTVYGLNFLQTDATATVTVAGQSCTTSTWSTATSLKCYTPKSSGSNSVRIGLTISAAQGTSLAYFSFDAPVISHGSPINGALTGATDLSVFGYNFGGVDETPSATIGETACTTTAWTSYTSVVAMGSTGTGKRLPGTITVSAVVGTRNAMFTYNAPVVTVVGLVNTPTSGGSSITLSGTNLGFIDFSSTAALGDTVCSSTAYTSSTSLVCNNAPGSGTARPVKVTVEAMVATVLSRFTYDAPVPTDMSPSNAATSGAAVVTISGLNFANANLTPSSLMGSSSCTTTGWTSATTVTCDIGPGYGSVDFVRAYVAGIAGTLAARFTFDSPSVSSTPANAPTLSSATLTIRGVNFGVTYASATAQVGSSSCLTTSWLTDTSVGCKAPSGSGVGQTISITLSDLVGTITKSFSYDGPVVTFVNAQNMGLTSGTLLTVLGTNFAQSNVTPTLTLGTTLCGTTSWTSGTMLTCMGPPGSGTASHIDVAVSAVHGTKVAVLTYDSPAVTFVEAINAPVTGGASITLLGVNFGGLTDLSPLVQVGLTSCQTTQYTTDTSVLCQSSIGVGGSGLSTILTVGAAVGTRTAVFTFDTPVLTMPSPGNTASTGGAVLTLHGANFGSVNSTPTVRMGISVCQTSVWTTDTQVTCVSVVGSGKGLSSMLTMSSVVGTGLGQFTYDAPVLTQVFTYNGPTCGGQPVTLMGHNFGTENYTPSITLLSKAVGTAQWTSDTTVKMITTSFKADIVSTLSALTVASSVGTLLAPYTYDAPTITQAVVFNGPTLGVNEITISGLNFAYANPTATVRIGAASKSSTCASNNWVSGTSVICVPQPGTGAMNSLALTISSLTGTSIAAYTFDAPVPTHMLNGNSALSGGSSLTVMGLNFGSTYESASMSIGSSSCGTVAWSSSTALSCIVVQGLNPVVHTPLTVNSIVGTLLAGFTYDSPLVSQSAQANMVTTAGGTLTMYGMNFGHVSTSATVSIGSSICQTSVWHTQSSVRCHVVSHGVSKNVRVGITLSGMVGTLLSAFTYDAPALTSVVRHNYPSCGLSSITLSGFNFGTYLSNVTPSVQLGTTACGTSSWTSVTTVKCLLSPGTGAAVDVGITVNTLVATVLSVFTFDSPIISTFSVTNAPQTGQTAMTIFGANLGLGDFSNSARVGSTLCNSALWNSATSIICNVASGSSAGLDTVLTIGGVVATLETVFTFDAPLLSFTQLYNMPSTAGGQVTIQGLNFGASDFTPTVRIQSTQCSTAVWTTSSAVKCVAPSGYGISRKLALTIGSMVGTSLGIFSYDSPMVTGLSLGNAPTTGGKSVTIQGSNFAIEDGTVTALVGASMCATTSWTSSTVVTCLLGGASAGSNYQVAVTLVGLIGTKQKVFSYDAPAVSHLFNPNAPQSGMPSITMTGTNFASTDYTMDGFVGATQCQSTSWISVTSAACMVMPGFGPGHTATLTVSSQSATYSMALSYDTPVVTYAAPHNAPNSAGVVMTVSGMNFGATNMNPTVQVAETKCSSSQWISPTSATCVLMQGVGVGPNARASEHRVAITVGTGVGTRTRAFTYDAPVVTYASRLNLPSTGGETITVSGVNFGLSDYSATVGVGKTACLTSSWSTLTSVVCVSPSGGGADHALAVTLVDISGTLAKSFSFDSPVLTYITGANGPASHGAVVTISGSGFGLSDNTPSAHVARTACASTSWQSISSVTCYTPLGSGGAHDLTMTVASLVGTVAAGFTYDSPVVSFTRGYNGAITGGSSVTVSGTNFGATDLTPTVQVSSVPCSTSVFVSATQLKCLQGGGYGAAQPVSVVLNDMTGTLLSAFSYDAPSVSQSLSGNGPTTAGPRLTISGSDFGMINLTPTAKVGKTRCATTSWMSATSLHCSVGSGVGVALTAAAEMFDLTGCLDNMFTYDSPVISLMSTNSPTTGGSSVTVSGTNFGAAESSMSARLGSTSCDYTKWISDTSAICVAPSGVSESLSAALTVAENIGSLVNPFSYDSPISSVLLDANAPSTAGVYVTVTGLNFGSEDLTGTVALSSISTTSCNTVSWSSSTALICSTSAGVGHRIGFISTISSLVGTTEALFSYDAPAMSMLQLPNSPLSGTESVTIHGFNFLSTDITPSVSMGTTGCATTSWSTSSSVVCASSIVGTGSKSATMSVYGLLGTAFQQFSFNAPITSHITHLNSAASGQTTITVSGLNFFTSDLTLTAYIGGAACTTASWTAATTLVCSNSASSGQAQSAAVGLAGFIGTLATMFSFDSPVASSASTVNAPSTAGASLSVFGTNFGMSDFTPSVQVGTSTCTTTSWTTSTTVVCQTPAGVATSLVPSLSISAVVGTALGSSFTYDTPVLSVVAAYNGPTQQGAMLSVFGTNFYTSDTTPSVHIGLTACTTTVWSAVTSLLCGVPSNVGLGHAVTLSGTIVATLLSAFSYDGPVITHATLGALAGANSPTTGEARITLHGTNFGHTNHSPTAMFGGAACASTTWVSETAVSCLVAPGYSIKKMAGLRLAGQDGTYVDSFTYDTAVISGISSVNAPPGGLASITVSGFNFVSTSDPTPSVRIGATTCSTASWSTDTQIVCLSPVGAGSSLLVSVTVGDMVGTDVGAFTYDSPVVDAIMNPNIATTAGAQVTVTGANFAHASGTGLAVQIGSNACTNPMTVSDTSLYCSVAVGADHSHDVHVTTSGLSGTLLSAFTYDAPVVSSASHYNSPTTGDSVLTIAGYNFAGSTFNRQGRIGSTLCSNTQWVSDTAATCKVTLGSGASNSIGMTVSRLIGEVSDAFTYDTPVVTAVAVVNAPASAGVDIRLHGTNFGGVNRSPVGSIGSNACVNTVWISATELRCGVPSSSGVGLDAHATVDSLAGTGLSLFTYDSPVVTFVAVSNTPTTGDILVTVSGVNFDSALNAGVASIGSTACVQTVWVSETSVTCKVPSGSGRNHVEFSQTGRTGTMLRAFSYDSPIITHTTPVNGPAKAGAIVTIEGSNFGPTGSSSTALVGISFCFNSEWVSTTSIQCTTPSGTGKDYQMNVVQNGLVGTQVARFSYDPPVIVSLSSMNGPLTESQLTLTGVNFAPFDVSPTVKLGLTASTSVVWVSDSLVTCTTPLISASGANAVSIEVGGLVSSSSATYQPDAPVISAITPANGPPAGGAQITVLGKGFGTAALHSQSSVGTTNCGASQFVSDTSVICTLPVGVDAAQSVGAVSSGMSGNAVGLFSYDGPSIAAVSPANALYVGQTAITVTGTNFAAAGGAVIIGSTSCAATTFVSHTSLVCSSNPLVTVQPTAPLIVTVANVGSTATATSPPAAGSLMLLNGPTNTTVQPIAVGVWPSFNANGTTIVSVTDATTYSQYTMTRPGAGVPSPPFTGTLHIEFASGYTPLRNYSFDFFKTTTAGDFGTSKFSKVTTNLDSMGAEATQTTSPTALSVTIKLPGCDPSLACYGHGTCEAATTGVCNCEPGYGGTDCETACYYDKTQATFVCECGAKLSGGVSAT